MSDRECLENNLVNSNFERSKQMKMVAQDSTLKRDKFCDFTVLIDKEKFHCHRVVLDMHSEYFKRVLDLETEEFQKNTHSLSGIIPETFNLILDIMYSMNMIDFLTEENMIHLWQAAIHLEMTKLISASEIFIKEHINEGNFFSVYRCSEKSQDVKAFLLKYVAKNFNALMENEQFSAFSLDDFLSILKHRDLLVSVDAQVDAILKWCTMKDGNLVHLGDLMQEVNLRKASRECLVRLMRNEMILANIKAVYAVNNQAAEYISEPRNVCRRGFQDLILSLAKNRLDITISLVILVSCLAFAKYGWYDNKSSPDSDSQYFVIRFYNRALDGCGSVLSTFYTAPSWLLTKLWPFN